MGSGIDGGRGCCINNSSIVVSCHKKLCKSSEIRSRELEVSQEWEKSRQQRNGMKERFKENTANIKITVLAQRWVPKCLNHSEHSTNVCGAQGADCCQTSSCVALG